MKKTALITGGNGFIGKCLTEKLLLNGYKVRIVSRRTPKKQPANPDVTVVKADYQDLASLQAAMEGCAVVYHLAAAIFGFKYEDFEKANVQGTQNVVDAVNRTPGIERFIYVSSLAASGFASDPKQPRTEDMEPAPVSDYGITKLAGEKIVREQLKPSVKWTIARPPIVYGKNDSGVSKIAAWVRRGIMVNTSGKGLFSVVHVDDLVTALAAFPSTPGTENQIFFICEETQYPWPDFIGKMAAAMGVKTPFMPDAPRWLLNTAAAVYTFAARISGAQPALNYDKVKEAVVPGHWICTGQKWQTLSGQKFTPLEEGLKKSF